jgi:hypothetical protein
MKSGDLVVHKTKGITGIIVSFGKRNNGVLVDISDKSGVLCRIFHRDMLRVVRESGE